ncbi:PREDICTED: uncharacterized protein LOC108972285 isoform X1 [Bactrocera latifrons]|uniref:uncharacterized protein LOC108972285 isoform X1 n=1 Tax=Bactrocera latifrons TaxID=174628 RepID=UPI0008DE2455|nr:PREDICTED: uncharacterized protein LOC108972285 isoform X1 [Bactrocera latifrons]XP_018794382.1 PREDICTED: uncharacterized protein LOC108972285 isoform X1 [Bactrocera latifrons]
MDETQKRTPNFTASELEQLLELVEKYKAVIEFKRTDTCTNAKKDAAWKRIEYDFTSQCPSGCHRSAKILKKKYLNLKREVKKRVAEDKRYLYLTGGGKPSKKLLTEFDEKLLTVLHEKQVSGMQSVYDNDVIAVSIDDEFFDFIFMIFQMYDFINSLK